MAITEAGTQFATSGVHRSHEIFKEQVVKSVPFLSTVMEAIRQKKDGGIGRDFFLDILDEHFSESESARQVRLLWIGGAMRSYSNSTPMKSGSIPRRRIAKTNLPRLGIGAYAPAVFAPGIRTAAAVLMLKGRSQTVRKERAANNTKRDR